MPTPVWQPGHLYPPGSLVRPLSNIPTVPTALQNPSFESGSLTGWTHTGTGTPSVTNLHPYSGSWNCTFYTNGGDPTVSGDVLNDEQPTCVPGRLITASIAIKLATQGVAAGRAIIVWFDSGGVEISRSEAPLLSRPGSPQGNYAISTVSGVAPAGTDTVAVGFSYQAGNGGDVRFDALTWNYNQASAPEGLIFKATQAEIGTSADVEPTWPATVGVPVNDGTVVWEGVIANRVVWQAEAVMVSGATEPIWPTIVGERITDNTISWETVARRVLDEKCPNSKVVAIMANKVFAVDKDIVRFSATVNPLDWSTPDDAGYLGTGLQQANANDMAVLAPYRSNLAAMNASSFQNWQVDPDPTMMANLDQMEGIGSTWQHAAYPVADDLFYLAALGVRSIGIAAGAENLAAGDVGMPVDTLVQPEIAAAVAAGIIPVSTYYPSQGQYWLAFPSPSAIACGVEDEYTGGQSFPAIRTILLGAGTGTVTLTYETGAVPDKFEVWFGGDKVIDTGYVGDVATYQTLLNNLLESRGLPPETMTEYAGPGVPMTAQFEKTTTDTIAYVRVFAPFTATVWNFTLSCPDGGAAPTLPDPSTQVFVHTKSGSSGKWSRYIFPFAVDGFAQLGNDLYIRNGDQVSLVDEDAVSDQLEDESTVEFGGVAWWNWLDFGQPGITKMLEGFDYVGTGQGPSIQIGYDQRSLTAFTPAYQLDNDTLAGGIIPLPVSAPTMSVKLTFAGGAKWSVNAVHLSFFDLGNGP